MDQVDHEVQIAVDDSASDDGRSAYQSIASSTTSLADSFRDYHFENGRTYHRYKEGKYYYPNDERENDRMDLQHHLALLTLGGKLGLAPPCDPDYKVNRAVDFGTGTGIWAIQFADDHPETEVLGVDLSPAQPDLLAPNLRFEVDDIEEEWMYSKPFDYIHSRHLTGSLTNWKDYITKCFNNLTPGGYLELQEVEFGFLSDDASLPSDAPLVRFMDLLNEAAVKIGRSFIRASDLRDLMKEAGFVDVTVVRRKWPINEWPREARFKELGAWNLENSLRALEALAMAPFTRVHGWTREEVEVFLVDVRRNLGDRGCHAYAPIYFLVGRKPLEEGSAVETPAAQV